MRDGESHQDRVRDGNANIALPRQPEREARRSVGGLARAGTERKRDVAPRVEVGRRCRQMEDEAAHRHDDVDAEFEQTLPQCGHLGAGARRARGPQPEFLHEHVRRGGEEHAQLIGPEATAAGASDLESVVEFLDPIFNVAACTVDTLVDEPWRLPQIRDHKARVVAGGTAGEADDFGFDHHAALVGPRPGGIARLGIDMLGLPARLALRPSLDHGGLGESRQHRVFRHGDDVVEAGFSVEPVEDLRRRKPAIQPYEKACPRKRDPQHVEQADQRAPRPARRRRVAGTKDRGAQVLLDLVIEGHEGQQREIAPAVVVPVEEGELLRAVGRVIGRVEIDGDVPGPPMQSLPMAVDDVRGELAAHRIERLRPDVVFEARDRRLRGERVAHHGVTPEQQLVNRIVGQASGVVGIGLAAGEPEDPLSQQVAECMTHLALGAIINQTAGEVVDQIVPALCRGQQDRAAV
jgi:hypothetical protein